jgi:UDP-N-acetylmuramate--alanine ligase
VTPAADGGVSCDLWRYNRRRMAQQRLGPLTIGVPGAHNVRNALAALAAVELLGADLGVAAAALASFRGTARRFEQKGEAVGVTVVDDYAHHPTEARATLAAARARFPGRRIVAYLQPHTFSRTAALAEEWAGACGDADVLLVGDVYAAREQGDAPGVARALAARIAATGVYASHVGGVDEAAAALIALAQPGDVVLTLGAGDGDRAGLILLEQLRGRA